MEKNSRCFKNEASSAEEFLNLSNGGVLLGLGASGFQISLGGKNYAGLDGGYFWLSYFLLFSSRLANSSICFFKLNFDSSALGVPRPAGIGSIIKERWVARWLLWPIGICFAHEAEASALLFGLKLCEDRIFFPLILKGFSLCNLVVFCGILPSLEVGQHLRGNIRHQWQPPCLLLACSQRNQWWSKYPC